MVGLGESGGRRLDWRRVAGWGGQQLARGMGIDLCGRVGRRDKVCAGKLVAKIFWCGAIASVAGECAGAADYLGGPLASVAGTRNICVR